MTEACKNAPLTCRLPDVASEIFLKKRDVVTGPANQLYLKHNG